MDKVGELKLLGEQRDLGKYFSKFTALNKKVENIVASKNKAEKKLQKTSNVKKSKCIIHNRINKAGSTSMLGEVTNL